jgi:predicted methyltransferase
MPPATRFASLLAVSLLALAPSACRSPASPEPESAAPPGPIHAAARAAVDAPDRSPEDRALDAGRRPVELLAFYGIGPGMRVAELGAGGGYTSELLARAVGPGGRVYAQNSSFILERFAQAPWTARLGKPVMQNVVRLDRPFDDPFPADLRDLDAVLIVLLYHDVVWMKADRERMNRAVFEALAPGGVYGVVDHSAKPGSGLAEVETTHRIDEASVRAEVFEAGFAFAGEGGFLRNPADSRDWNASPRVAGEQRGTSDRFALKFVKPGPTAP